MKYFTIIVMVLLASSKTQAQDTIALSLNQAFEIGLANRYDVQANQINVDLARNAVSKNKKEWIPEIDVIGDARYNSQLQTSVLEGYGKIQMGTKNYTSLSIDLTQPIYKPGLSTDIKIAQNEVLLEQERNKGKEISIKQSIAQAYLNVILRKIQWDITSEISKRKIEYNILTGEKIKLGTSLGNDYMRAKLDCENALFNESNAKQNYELAMIQLKYQLNIDNPTIIILTDSIESFQKEDSYTTVRGNYERTELKQLELEYKSAELKLKKSSSYFLPTVSFVAHYTTEFQSSNYNYFQNNWSPYNYIGIRLSLPITGNFKNTNTRNEYRLKMSQTALDLKQKQQEIDTETLQYRTELLNARNAIKVSENNLELAKEVHKVQLNMYQLGTVTYSSVLDTESSLITSEQNYVESVYNYLLAKVNYEKATGRL